MKNTMQIVTKGEGFTKPGKVVQFRDTGLRSLQALVGGFLECVYVPELQEQGIDLWANEEGKFTHKPNFMLPWGDTVHGPVFFAAHDDEGGTVALTDEQAAFVLGWLSDRPQAVVL